MPTEMSVLPGTRVGNAVFHDHLTPDWETGFGDVFVLHASPKAGLPPWLWGQVAKEAGKVLYRVRPMACIWVQTPPVEHTGKWWHIMVSRFLGPVAVPVAIGQKVPSPGDFSFLPKTTKAPLPAGRLMDKWPRISEAEGLALGVLARIHTGYTAEIASLSMILLPTTRKVMRQLGKYGLVTQKSNRWPYWEITRKGVSLALRMWGVPKGARFPVRTERRTKTAYKHRRASRLWNAWLREAGFDVVGGWSEVILPGARGFAPDALAWGWVGKHETLFWLEVESGHRSRAQIAAHAEKRLLVAQGFARLYGVRLAFALLGVSWAVQAAMQGMTRIEPFTTVLLGDWNRFGELPKVRWGAVQW